MVKISMYSWCIVNKNLAGLIIGVLAIIGEAVAQTPGVFNFENATNVSELPEQLAASSSPSPTMEKRYYIDPSSQLFDAIELRKAYEQINRLRPFYASGGSRNSPQLWAQTRNILFADRATKNLKCEPLDGGVLNNTEPDARVDYNQKLIEALGRDFYTELQFSLNYIGLQYSDWELWQAYISSRTALVNEINNLSDVSRRLKAIIVAVDIKYTLCVLHPDIPCLVSSINSSERKQ
jgi:hypothetical protein